MGPAAASRQIAAHGTEVAFSAIAGDAGVGIATLYRNFPTRQDLVLSVLSELRDQVTELVTQAQVTMDADPDEGWSSFARALAELRPGALVAPFSEELVGEHHLDALLQAQRREFIDSVQRTINRAIEAGAVRPDLTAQQFQMGLASVTRPLPQADLPQEIDHRDWLIDVYLRGLRP